MIYKNSFKVIVALLLFVLLAVTACGQPPLVEIHQLSAIDARAVIDSNTGNTAFVVLDVRTPKEFKQGHIAGAAILDYHSPGFTKGLQMLDKSKTYFIYCRTGNRSGRALKMIEKMGFSKIYHLKNGVVDWQARRLPLVKS